MRRRGHRGDAGVVNSKSPENSLSEISHRTSLRLFDYFPTIDRRSVSPGIAAAITSSNPFRKNKFHFPKNVLRTFVPILFIAMGQGRAMEFRAGVA